MSIHPTRRNLLSGVALTLASSPLAPALQRKDGSGSDGDAGAHVMVEGVLLFTGASALSTEADVVHTAGYAAVGQGAARYIHDSSVDADFVTDNPRVAFVSANGHGFRLDPQQHLTIQMFGGKADGSLSPNQGARLGTIGPTDNAAALNAALAYLDYNHIIVGSNHYYASGGRIHFPAQDGVYDFASSVSIRRTIRLTGDSSGHGQSGHGSQLRWRPGMHGLIFEFYGSDSQDRSLSPARPSGVGSVVDGLYLVQHKTRNDFRNDNYHAIFMRASITVRNCTFIAWSGTAVEITAGVPRTNANLFLVENCTALGCEHGFRADGGDANAGVFMRCDATQCRGYGILDSGFLGNTIIGCHVDECGVATSEGAYNKGAACSFRGNRYTVRAGQAAAASTNAPSGTATSNSWWFYMGTGTPDASFPAWVPGLEWREGGAYRCDAVGAARTIFTGCYSEGSSAASYIVRPAVVIGGLHAAPIDGDGTVWDNILGNTTLSTPLSVKDAYKISVNGTPVQVVGPQQPAIADHGSDSKVNQILAALRAHGLIAP